MNVSQYMLNNETIDNQETVEISGRRNMNVSQYMLNNETIENQETVEISGRRNMNVSQYMLNNKPNMLNQVRARTLDNMETIALGDFNMTTVVTARDDKAVVTALDDKAVVTARDEAVVTSRDEAVVTARDEAVVTTHDEAVVTARDEAVVTARDEAVVTTHDEAVVTARDEAVVTARDEAVVTARDEAVVTTHDEAVVTACDKAVVTALDDKDLEGFRIKPISTFLGQKQFECPWKKWQTPETTSLLKWKFMVPDNSNIPKTKEVLDKILPVLPIVQQKLEHPPESEIQVTWIGHATMLVQMDGITILTDPVFREYCGPELAQTMHLGYKRYRSAACQVTDLPHLDAVIISNDYFDHLDWKSAQAISARFPDVKWFVGKNGRDLCPSKKANNVTDMLWWEEAEVTIKGKEFTFACTPAQHWCRRTAFDMNKRLWCSWTVKGPTKNFFFAGDTGYYQPVFEKIGKKYGPFSLAAIPIGCSEPRHIVKYQHVNPREAVDIHHDIKSEQSIAILWGAFHMTNEFYLSPPRDLEKFMGKDRDKFISMQHGETWVVGEDRKRPIFIDPELGTIFDGMEGAEWNK